LPQRARQSLTGFNHEGCKSQGVNATENTTIELEISEEEIALFQVPDEVLEIVAGAVKQMTNFSVGYCSALSVCDG